MCIRDSLFSDIVGFTNLSSNNESLAIQLLDKQRSLLKPIVENHSGEWLKEMGDGLLLSFDSSLDAVKCSIKMQQAIQDDSRLNLRIGIHQGDIYTMNQDVYGDDVNIASRIESLAPEGGVCISDKVHSDISGTPDVKTQYIGYRKLKGVGQDTKIYCIIADGLTKFRRPLLPLITGWSCLTLGFLGLIGALIGSIFSDFASDFNTFMRDAPKAFMRHLAFIMIGYSNLMYVSGVSSKSQKYLVYTSYALLLFFCIGFLFVYLTEPPENF